MSEKGIEMDARPIGIFDSGLGGLTMVKKLTEFLPREEIIYLGDTGRVPYGSRSRETIIKYARQDAAFLVGFDIKAMVIACNTVCSVAFDILDSIYEIPIYEVVSAPAKAAAACTINGKIGVIGTAATIRSGAYEMALKRIAPDLRVISTPCPLFVPMVENGRNDASDIAALTIAGDYLAQLREAGVDTLILGCTHYPLLREVISKVMGRGVTLIDSGAETAKLVAEDLYARGMTSSGGAEDLRTGGMASSGVAEDLRARGMASSGGAKGATKYFVTDGVDGFSELASRFLESNVGGMVKQITLE